MMKFMIALTVALFMAIPTSMAAMPAGETSLLTVQQRWAQINYQLPEEQKVDAYIALIEVAKGLVETNPENADYYIWLGIIESSTAGAKGGLGALKFADAAKEHFEQAMELDENALSGSALTSLGVLYHKLPGWPISFGSDKKARKLLNKAIAVNPEGIDTNYFYAEFLFDKGDYAQAKSHLEIAQRAPARPDRPLADSGRQAEIQQLMEKVTRKL